MMKNAIKCAVLAVSYFAFGFWMMCEIMMY